METAPVSTQIERLLHQTFRHPEFRPGQRTVIERVLAAPPGRALLAVLPAGGGKSLCYQLPALMLPGLTVVVCPLVSLMKDQVDGLCALGVQAVRVDSTQGPGEAELALERAARGGVRLLYVAPERFVAAEFQAFLARAEVSLVAVDEAQCVSEWGHSFRPDYLRVAGCVQRLGARALLLTSALSPEVREEICRAFRVEHDGADLGVVTAGFSRPNVSLLSSPTARAGRDAALLERLRARPAGATIVYVGRQEAAERLAQHLRRAGVEARPYHAGFSEEARTEIQEWWTRAKAVVVATIAFGIGIHRPDLRYIYHYDLPRSLEELVQEAGRAGRDGGEAIVEILGAQEDVAWLENHILGETPALEAVRAVIGELLVEGGPEVSLDLAGLARRADLRPSILRALLIRLEALGLLQPGAPWFATWKIHPTRPIEDILRGFDPDRARFLRRLFAAGERAWGGWYTLQPAAAAKALGEDRDRVCRALDWLGRQGMIEIRRSDLQLCYRRSAACADPDGLARRLLARLVEREAVEVQRVHEVLALMTAPACQEEALWAHFGGSGVGGGRCGRCSFCRSGRVSLPAIPATPEVGEGLDAAALQALCADHPQALGAPRQLARFLCGLSSPATVAARLVRHDWFGCRSEQPFDRVLAYCEELPARARKAA